MNIYKFSFSFDFLMQSVKILHIKDNSEQDLNIIYEYILLSDVDTLKMYKNKCIIPSYKNDLELFIEVTKEMIKIYEDMEEYEKCSRLLVKQKFCENLIV